MTHRLKTPKTDHRNFFAEWNQRDKEKLEIDMETDRQVAFGVPALAVAILNKGIDLVGQNRSHQ